MGFSNYEWKKRDPNGTIKDSGSLMAKNLWEAKHLSSVYFQFPDGEWVSRPKCQIYLMHGESDYITLEQIPLMDYGSRRNDQLNL